MPRRMRRGALQLLIGLGMGLLIGSTFFVTVPLSLNYRPVAAGLILLCWIVVLLAPTDSSNPETTFRAAFGRLDPARRVKLDALFLGAAFAFLHGTNRLAVTQAADRLVALAFAGSFLALAFAVPVPQGH